MPVLDTRQRPAPIRLAPEIALARLRAHEATGSSRRLFALLAAAATQGSILWLACRWMPERLAPDGIAPCLDPGRLLIGRCRDMREILWCAEEALRSGAVPLVVADLAEPPALTPVRRLHLAAEAGGGRDGAAPACLLLAPGTGGAAGIETRWHLSPLPGWAIDGRARWRLVRLRARTDPPAAWEMRLRAGRPHLRRIAFPDPLAA